MRRFKGHAGVGAGRVTMILYLYRDTATGPVAMTSAEPGGSSGLEQQMTMVISATQTTVGMLGCFI